VIFCVFPFFSCFPHIHHGFVKYSHYNVIFFFFTLASLHTLYVYPSDFFFLSLLLVVIVVRSIDGKYYEKKEKSGNALKQKGNIILMLGTRFCKQFFVKYTHTYSRTHTLAHITGCWIVGIPAVAALGAVRHAGNNAENI
jgi:hypothetical protein